MARLPLTLAKKRKILITDSISRLSGFMDMIEIEKMTYQEILNDERSDEAVKSAMKNWPFPFMPIKQVL